MKIGGGADLSKILPPKSEGQTILAYPQNPNLVGEEEGGGRLAPLPSLQVLIMVLMPVISMYSTPPVIDHILGM